MAYDKNPIDTLAPLAAAGVRILHIAGDSDIHVPIEENSQIVYDRYIALGGEMDLMVIEGGSHLTAWSLTDEADHDAIVDFITTPTPEPATMTLLAAALPMLICRRRNR